MTAPEPSPVDDHDHDHDHGPTRGRRGLVLVAGLVALALLVGVGGGFLLGRGSTPGDTSVDAGFARDMSVHHGQAVDMALTLYGSAPQEPELRQVAYDIATTQQAQIGIMSGWLQDWGLSPTGSEPTMSWMAGHAHGDMAGMTTTVGADGLMPGMATAAQLAELKRLRGTAQEVLFCQLMLRHHEGGIAMARVGAAEAGEQEVRELAAQMVAAQQGEVRVLTRLLAERGARPLPA